MSKLKSVQLAIEHATRQRDELAKTLARVERAVVFVHQQMAQLQGYATDTDTRWIGSGSKSLSTELVHHHYQFMDRLQQAIRLQSGVVENTARQLEQAKLNLLQAEFRLSGLNQILKTRQADLMCLQRRREQRQTDEYAALQYSRNRARPMSGERHDN
jgi:flagellar FliJ protein